METFVKSPYRALVMVIITGFLGFLGYHLVIHVEENMPTSLSHMFLRDNLWLIPAVILTYVWLAATLVSAAMVFLSRPLIPFQDRRTGFLYSFTVASVAGIILTILFMLVSDPRPSFDMGLVLALTVGFIVGLDGEIVRKPKPEQATEVKSSTQGEDAPV